MPNIILELGNTRIVVDSDKITPNDMVKMSNELLEVKKKNSLFGKYPIEDHETLEQWEERIRPQFNEQADKKADETSKEYLERLFKASGDKQDVLFDTIKALATAFKQEDRVTREAYDVTPYVKAKKFVVELLKTCDFPTSDFE